MVLEQILDELESEHSNKIKDINELEDPELISGRVMKENRIFLRKQKRTIDSHWETYPLQKTYTIEEDESQSCENRMIISLEDFFGKKNKKGNLKLDNQGKVKYRLRHRVEPTIPPIFNEISATVERFHRKSLRSASLGELTGICIWGGINGAFFDLVCGFGIFSLISYGIGLSTSTHSLFGNYLRKAINPDHCIETAKKTDNFLVETIKPIYLARETDGIYR